MTAISNQKFLFPVDWIIAMDKDESIAALSQSQRRFLP